MQCTQARRHVGPRVQAPLRLRGRPRAAALQPTHPAGLVEPARLRMARRHGCDAAAHARCERAGASPARTAAAAILAIVERLFALGREREGERAPPPHHTRWLYRLVAYGGSMRKYARFGRELRKLTRQAKICTPPGGEVIAKICVLRSKDLYSARHFSLQTSPHMSHA